MNKYIKLNCAPSWTYLRECTGMHGQQNIKFKYSYFVSDGTVRLPPKFQIYLFYVHIAFKFYIFGFRLTAIKLISPAKTTFRGENKINPATPRIP